MLIRFSYSPVFLLFLAACGVETGPADDGSGGTNNSAGGDSGGSDGASSGGSTSASGGRSSGSTGGSSSSGGSPSSCSNVRPTGTDWDEASCDEWASETEECDEDWMVEGDYCNQSCGRCSGGGGGGTPVDLKKFVGNITTNNAVDPEGLKYATYWDQITPENAGKWGSVQPYAGTAYNWGTLDAIYDYAEQNDVIFKQHAFVWGSQQPNGNITESDVKDWISSFCARYPNTRMIDVVNEPPPHTTPAYADAIGGGTDGDWQWITNSFKWAREACPDAILILNDFNNIEWPNDAQHFVDITNIVLRNGGPIDALGAQAHDLDHEMVTTERMKELLEKLKYDTGLDVYITEYDIDTDDDARQLQIFQEQIPYFLETDFIKGVTLWGWIYGATWSQAPRSGLVRNGQPRPAMTWLMETLGRPVP